MTQHSIMFKVNKENTRLICWMCSKLALNISEHWRHFGVFLVHCKHIFYINLVFLWLTLNISLRFAVNLLKVFQRIRQITRNKYFSESLWFLYSDQIPLTKLLLVSVLVLQKEILWNNQIISIWRFSWSYFLNRKTSIENVFSFNISY